MSDALAQFNDQKEVEKACQTVRDRMGQDGFEEGEVNENLQIMAPFAQIAVTEMIRKRGGIPVPGNPNELIPYDLKMARQSLALFTEGMYHAFTKCRELRIKPSHVLADAQTGQQLSLKAYVLQSLALEVFNQVDNLVASTLGQDGTPEFQINEATQQGLIHQTVESMVLYIATEYEKQYGPIITEEEAANLLDSSSATTSEAPASLLAPAAPPPVAAGMSTPLPTPAVQKPVPKKGPSPHDKYAAVALMLETLPAKRKKSLLSITAKPAILKVLWT